LFRTSALSHVCKTPPVEGAGAGSLPVPYPGGAKKKKKKSEKRSTISIAVAIEINSMSMGNLEIFLQEIKEVLTLWHTFLFLGVRFFPLFFFLLDGLHSFFL
jgi:hypothetical protein